MIRSFDVVHDNKDCILFADKSAFYIAERHRDLKQAQLDLLRRGNCTIAQMQEMGVSGTTIARKDIRGISVEGFDRADELIFHLNNKKKIAILFSKQYDKEDSDAFFKGLPRFQKSRGRLTRPGKRHKDWRVREQDPAVRKRLDPIVLALKWASVLTIAGLFLKPDWLNFWLLLSFLWVLAGLVLLFFFEPYVTLLGDKEYRKVGYSAKIIHLDLLPWLPCGVMALLFFERYAFFDIGRVLIWGMCIGLVFALVMWVFLREIQGNGMLAVMVAFVCCFFCMGIISHGNHILAWEEMTAQQVVIVDKDTSSGGRGRRDYDLTVELSDGRRLTMDVSRDSYNSYEIGDEVQIHTRTGAFGLEYGMFNYKG